MPINLSRHLKEQWILMLGWGKIPHVEFPILSLRHLLHPLAVVTVPLRAYTVFSTDPGAQNSLLCLTGLSLAKCLKRTVQIHAGRDALGWSCCTGHRITGFPSAAMMGGEASRPGGAGRDIASSTPRINLKHVSFGTSGSRYLRNPPDSWCAPK